MEKYICWDGVDMEFSFHETKEESIQKLNNLIANGIEGDEWMDGVENSYVAVIINKVEKKKVDPPDEYDGDIKNFVEMNIIEIN